MKHAVFSALKKLLKLRRGLKIKKLFRNIDAVLIKLFPFFLIKK